MKNREDWGTVQFEDAVRIVSEAAKPLGAEHINMEHALNRVLFEDVISDIDMPPFNKSAMDGYACRREDIQNEMTVIETVAAGIMPTKPVGKNQCTKIMTGAKVPDGADVVIMVEHTENAGTNKIRFTGTKTSDNIARQAEDVKKGDVVLHKGQLLKSQHIAILASAGCYNPVVSKQPRTGILATGSELVEPDEIPNSSQIRNSNAYQLINQVRNVNAIPCYYGIAKDDPVETEAMIKKALSECDLIIMTGGVSMGDFDFIPSILKKNNITLLFEKLNVKPGRPTVFGMIHDKYVFGLPGNPVSSFFIFEMLVKPFLYGMMGHNFRNPSVFMPLEQDFSRKDSSRLIFAPVIYTEKGTILFSEYHGSAHIHSLSQSDGICIIPAGVSTINKGELVHVRPL